MKLTGYVKTFGVKKEYIPNKMDWIFGVCFVVAFYAITGFILFN